MKYLKTHLLCALIAALITTLVAMFEILFLQGQNDAWAAVLADKKFYATLAASYFAVFALGYFLALACVGAAEKFFKNWILSYIFGFAVYFAAIGFILYATSRVGSPQAQEAGILEFYKNFARFGIIMSLQTFTISFAFIRIAKKKLLSDAE